MGWDEVTIYMKRMVELPLRRVAAVIARKTVSLWETTNGNKADRQAFCNYFRKGSLQEIGPAGWIAAGRASPVGCPNRYSWGQA
jgi:hypothetical protein